MLPCSAVRLRVGPWHLAHCRYFYVSNMRVFRDFFAEVAETRADYMQKKSRQCVQDFARKTHSWTAEKCRQPAKEIANNTAVELQKKAVTFHHFLQFSCGVFRDLFCRLSAFLLQLNCGPFSAKSTLLRFFLHVICACFRYFFAEVAETPADYMENNRDNVFKSLRNKPTVKLQQKSRQPAKEIANNTAT